MTSAEVPPPFAPRAVPWVGIALVAYLGLVAIVWATGSNWLPVYVASVALVTIISAGIGDVIAGRALGLLVDDRRMISLSRFQMMVWTALVLGAVLAAFIGNIRGGSDAPLDVSIPNELLIMMGIASTSLVGSPAIRTLRRTRASAPPPPEDAEGVAAGIVALRGSEVVNRRPNQARFTDMFRGEEGDNHNLPDIGKIQNFIITVIVALAYFLELAGAFFESSSITAFPALDQSIITLVGISHAGYLTLKAVPQGAPARSAEGAVSPDAGAIGSRRAAAERYHPGTEPTE